MLTINESIVVSYCVSVLCQNINKSEVNRYLDLLIHHNQFQYVIVDQNKFFLHVLN